MSRILYGGLEDYVVTCLKEGKMTVRDIYDAAKKKLGYRSGWEAFRKYVYRVKKRYAFETKELAKSGEDESLIELILYRLQDGIILNLFVICDELQVYPRKIKEVIRELRSRGYEIIWKDDQIWLSDKSTQDVEFDEFECLEETDIIFGVASDLHFGSKACQITAMHKFADICRSRGVKHMFVPGDITAGYKTYAGQEMEVYAISAQEQEDSVILNLPKGLNWFMLGGNHDYTFIKRGGGHNPLLVIANARDDITYCGFDDVVIPILRNVDLRMWHPAGGVPYSYSYRLQKGVEQVAFDELKSIIYGKKEKPTVRFVLSGHLHIQLQAMFGSILGMQCGTFEGTTSYLRRKGLVPAIGGYIVEASLGKNGLLKNFSTKFYVFEEIENDWKNYRHSITRSHKLEKPVFEK